MLFLFCMPDIFSQAVRMIDAGKFVEKASILKSRRTRLLEDFEKDEADKLKRLEKEFVSNFKITKESISF